MFNKYREKDRYAFLLGVLLGLVVFIIIYGINVINPCNVTWLLHSDDIEGSIDLTQHYMGWVYYRDTPWTFPIGLTEGLYIKPVSVVYTDSIPLFAVFFKLFSGILPTSFQYMGIFGLCCYALMGGFGALVTRRFSSNVIVNVISALFFVLSPVLLNRMYLHTALAAHFLIVAGIVVWLYRDRMKRGKALLSWTVLLACGTLINPYFTPFLYGILLCAVLQDLIGGGKVKHCIVDIVLPLAVTIFAAWIIGMFYGDTNPGGSGGLAIHSFNMDALVNPVTYASDFGHFTYGYREITYSSIIDGFPLADPRQNEGFAYLGLGMIFLSIISIVILIAYVIRRRRIVKRNIRLGKYGYADRPLSKMGRRKVISYVIALSVYLVVFTFLALSPTWTIGETELFSIPYPDIIWDTLSIYRSSGRFIWPTYYMIMSLSLIIPSYIFVHKKNNTYAESLFPHENVFMKERITVIFIMALCLLVQIIDLSSAIMQKRYDFHKDTEYVSDLQSLAWEEIAGSCDTIVTCPPSRDLYMDNLSAMSFEIYAKEHDMSMNITYLSRNLSKYADRNTYEEFCNRGEGITYPNHMYLFLRADEEDLPDGDRFNLNYYYIDGYIVGLDKGVNIY